MRRIRLMREAIFKRRTRKDEVQSKGPNRELSRLQNGNYEPAKPWILDNIEKIKVSSICIFCAKTFERRAALITHTKNCSQRGKHSINNGPASTVDDDNVDKSAQSFMAMLKKEKEIQANVQKCIDEEEDQLIVAEADENSQLGNDTSVVLVDVTKGDLEEVTVVKNKRKRNIVQKVDQPKSGDNNGNSTWHMEENDRLNGDLVMSAAESDATSVKPSEKKKKKKLVLEKTTDCTMCSKKFTNISNLRRHVAMLHYRQKTFGCKLCDYKAFRKIDITNHLGVCHNIGGEPDVCSELVVNIQIDSNKFNDEKIKAVAPALNKIEQELLNQSNEPDKMDTAVGIPNLPDVTIHPIICNEAISAGSSSNSPEKLTNTTDAKENSSSAEKLKKRGRRFKATKLSNSTESRPISHNSSSDSLPESQPSQMNRPVRNRVKIMNKDFVYDLSNLLRKEAVVYKEQLIPIVIKSQKRKLSQTTEVLSREKEDIVELLPKKLSHVDCIIGSANSMAKQAIDSFRACSNKPPELPSERPIVPAKIIQMRRSTNGIHNWRVIHNEDGNNCEQQLSRQSSSDKLFEVLANKNRIFEAGGTMIGNGIDFKQDINVSESTSISSIDEIITPITGAACLLDRSDTMICSNELVCQSPIELVVNNETDPNNAFLVSTQTEPLPTNGNSKRITLLQRLIDNNKFKEKGN